MTIRTAELYFEKPVEDIYITNITMNVQKSVQDSRVRNGIATIFVGCSTASISTMQYNDENVKEMKAALETFTPSNSDYLHHKTSADMYGVGGDLNGKSHVRSAMMSPSITVPLKDGRLMLDAGQDIVLLDFDIIKRKGR